MTYDKDSEDALTIAYLLGVKHGRAEQNTQTDALEMARAAAIEECAALAKKLWLDGEPYSEVFDHIRALTALEQSK